MIANFRQVAGEGELRVHPIVGRLVDREMLTRMTGAREAAATQTEATDG
ncbi:hypothetical protein [Sulfitobacter albidus]|nr:hypothetical protein [Sulfitobacter albidus]